MTSFKEVYRRPPIEDRDFVLQFGKYCGKRLGLIMEVDPRYIAWLLESTDFDLGFELEEELQMALETWNP